ncbi:MAG: phytanoyl-CoA dioxygenase family protein [Gammaproteobacteria bacterium]|nr:phytanoyl-CoA dioxygenase family protein [Gammaproteobacteria bacterium]
MSIPQYPQNAPIQEITAALEDSGCVVVSGLMDSRLRQSVTEELAPHMAKARVIEDDDPAEFYPGQTRRLTALVTRSAAVADNLIAHPISRQVCETFLLPNGEYGYQLHVTAALEVGPGARAQVLHREEDSFAFFSLPRPNLIVASMWAITDFRSDNGATLLAPGSHKWPEDRVATNEEIVQAEMPAGSVLYWMGGLLHGAGANTSQELRYGVILTYSVGWVRQEENQYLDVAPERLSELSPEVKQIVGFDMYRALGFHDPSVLSDQSPTLEIR